MDSVRKVANLAAVAVCVLSGLLLCGRSSAQLLAPNERASNSLHEGLSQILASGTYDSTTTGTRDLSEAALLSVMMNGDATSAERWLTKAFSTQDMDPSSATYGELRLFVGDAAVSDLNAVEFSAQATGPLLDGFSQKFPAEFLRGFQPHLQAAIAGIERHQVPITDTNMTLMKATNLILLGQYAHDQNAVSQGEDVLRKWIVYTRSNGIYEFDSPTYYKTDLNSLVEGYRYAANPRDRRTFAAILDYFWSDIGANFFAPGDKLAGPYGRNYDFLRGLGGIDGWLSAAGWASTVLPSNVVENVFLYDNSRPGGYWPSTSVRSLAFSGPREVTSLWDGMPTHLRWNWMGRNVTMGCSSGDVGGDETMFAATLAGARTMPFVSIVVDPAQMPWGIRPNAKPLAWSMGSACVEHGGAVLLTEDVDPGRRRGPQADLTTNVLLPSDAQISVNGNIVKFTSPGEVPVPLNAVVTASTGGGTVAMRLIFAEPLNGHAPTLALATDALGLAHRAVRLKLTHLQVGEPTASRSVKAAWLFLARDDASPAQAIRDLQNAAARSSISGDTWTVFARLPQGSLEVRRSASNRAQIFGQIVNGQQVTPVSPLAVDGRDLSQAIWSKI